MEYFRIMSRQFLLIIFLLLTFVGQSFAATTVSCSMDSQDMDMSMTTTMDTMDDCMKDCNCPMPSCLSVIIPPTLNLESEIILSHNINTSISITLVQPSNSLYRPPITQ